MREILFRGKTDKGEWVVGLPTRKHPFDKKINRIQLLDDYYENDITEFFYVKNVLPETVGQYTGLTDKNGKKIFEGDILKGEQYPYKDCGGYYNYFAEVVWFNNSPAFGIYTFKNPKSDVRGISTGNTSYMDDFASEDWEVIGNIHDNPELLKGE